MRGGGRAGSVEGRSHPVAQCPGVPGERPRSRGGTLLLGLARTGVTPCGPTEHRVASVPGGPPPGSHQAERPATAGHHPVMCVRGEREEPAGLRGSEWLFPP